MNSRHEDPRSAKSLWIGEVPQVILVIVLGDLGSKSSGCTRSRVLSSWRRRSPRWGYSTELAGHLFRECWAEGTGSDVDLCRAFGWEVEAHNFKVATAADWWRSGTTVESPLTGGRKRYPVAGMPDQSRLPEK
jgi:hypothetical protein